MRDTQRVNMDIMVLDPYPRAYTDLARLAASLLTSIHSSSQHKIHPLQQPVPQSVLTPPQPVPLSTTTSP